MHGRPSSGPEKRAILYPSVRDQPRQLSKLDIGSWADFPVARREKNNAGDMMLLVCHVRGESRERVMTHEKGNNNALKAHHLIDDKAKTHFPNGLS